MGRRFTFIFVAMLPLAACSLVTSLDGLTGGSEDAGARDDSTSGDRDGTRAEDEGHPATGGDSSTGGDSGPGNLVTNPGFESGKNGCGSGWSGGYGATDTLTAVARSGAASCMLCPAGANPPSFALQPTNPLSLPAGSYRAEAWIRSPVSGATAGLTGVIVSAVDGTTFQGTQVRPDIDWVASTKTFTLSQPTDVTLQVHTYFPMDGCVLVDDVAIYAQGP
jgi:hypothetical protein